MISKDGTDEIIHSRLNWGSHRIFLKKWRVEFEVKFDKLELVLVWVKPPSLLLILWSDDLFREIGNSLGLFYKVEKYFHTSGYMGMAYILVGINLSTGLKDTITI
jgi:hypothetical protein